jgi:D-alanyl-D-alanine carboxypeptidase (penicillin-binding protein 5/6)
LFSQNLKAEKSQDKEVTPQVLGASTSVRGEENQFDASTFTPIKAIDTTGIKAKSYLVFDLSSGQNLLEKNSSQKFSIASLTKLLTALVAYKNIDLSQNITITNNDILKVKPVLSFAKGDILKAADVFDAMLIGSCNDAALALGNFVATTTGQSFVSLMNAEAENLEMTDSHFSNPMGFDSTGNYSTAMDIKKLITATQSLAAFQSLGRRTSYQFNSALGNSYSTVATNTLIRAHDDIQAIKTGYTGEAGGAMATKIKAGGREIVILVLNSSNRESDTLKLREEVLNDYNWN